MNLLNFKVLMITKQKLQKKKKEKNYQSNSFFEIKSKRSKMRLGKMPQNTIVLSKDTIKNTTTF